MRDESPERKRSMGEGVARERKSDVKDRNGEWGWS